jgi:hypothetical protein
MTVPEQKCITKEPMIALANPRASELQVFSHLQIFASLNEDTWHNIDGTNQDTWLKIHGRNEMASSQ